MWVKTSPSTPGSGGLGKISSEMLKALEVVGLSWLTQSINVI